MPSARDELRDFLRSRRARVLPEDVGIDAYGVRRVPGLRREELSRLAGVSVDYYTELEQGRAARPSAGVLDVLAWNGLGAALIARLRSARARRAQHCPAAVPQ